MSDFKETNEWNTNDCMKCEQHPDKPFPHYRGLWDECEGPGIPDYQGRVNVAWLKQGLKMIANHHPGYCAPGHPKMVESILKGDVTHF